MAPRTAEQFQDIRQASIQRIVAAGMKLFAKRGYLFFLLKRKMPLEETISVPFAFSLYYIGFALLTINDSTPIHGVDFLGITLFIVGSFINTFSELQRHIWKQDPAHKGMLYTKGLFGYSDF